MVAGFVPPSAGRVQVHGKDITRLAAHRRNMGVAFQSYALFPHFGYSAQCCLWAQHAWHGQGGMSSQGWRRIENGGALASGESLSIATFWRAAAASRDYNIIRHDGILLTAAPKLPLT